MILITGATGSVGRAATGLLLKEGEKVAAVTRDPARAALPEDALVVEGDPSNPATLTAALGDTEAILLSPRAAGRAVGELLSLAARQGVRRVVVLSATTVEHPAGLARFADQFRAVEEIARASGLEWTVLRCADFAANSLAWAPQIRATGSVRGAFGGAASSPIHERDIAEVAVRALRDSVHTGQSYLLTGPESLTQQDKVRLIGEAIGADLHFEELPPEQIRLGMLAAGLPEDVPERLLGSLADYAKAPGPTSDAVAQVLGRPAATFADWAADNAGAFRG
ncbi:NAD(P)H-binding protein [Amycolatopsis sp. H20-H5]|uniref:NAD(P)H-binding protein n=1 Tax=Amycolatopsis sp. H20-H5 TaxID=3046309 RepID=UPI002DBB6DDF|nr:NAD(P)H-binding protein [Amycolatopsis sp. H20-H5]MEC3980496.1 NAD(P)H-binding protein [Amycolatopsis sp. H20-H5]